MSITFKFLEAGVGDAILISSEGKNILIDGGEKYQKISSSIDKIDKQELLDLVILTHIDCDHIKGLIELLKKEEKIKLLREIWFNPSLNDLRFGSLKQNRKTSAKQGLNFTEKVKELMEVNPHISCDTSIYLEEKKEDIKLFNSENLTVKAIEYNPKYEVYFLHAKNLRKQNKKNAKDLDSTNYSPLTNEGRQVIRLLEEQLQLKSSFETLKQNCLNLLAMYYQQDRKGENPEINDAKAKIFFTLGALYYKHKKYNDSKNALLGSINLLEKDTTQNKSLIRCYRKLVNTFCKQEKYEEAKEYCLKIVENSESTEKNKFEVYTGLLSISYFLKEDEEQINKYYQKANKCLNAIIKQDKSTNHERLTNHLKKTWLATQKNIVNKDLKVQNSMQQGILSLEKSNNDLKLQLKDFENRMEIVTDSIKDNKAEIENYVEYKTQEIAQKLNDIKNILNKFSPSSFDLLRKFFKWIKEKIFKVKS